MGCFGSKSSTSEQDPFEAETDIVRQVSSYDAHVQEDEDEQVALAIQQSQQEEEERRRTRDLEEKHAQERGETQNYDNSSSSLKDKQDGQTSEEKDKRKQFEEHVKQDEQLPPPPPPPLEEEHNNISSRAALDDEQRIIRESLKDKGQTKPSEDDDNRKLVEAIPPPSMCGGCHFEIEDGGSSVDVNGVPWHPKCFSCGACHNPIAIHDVHNHVSNLRGKFHKACYERYCYVCEKKVKMKEYSHHHFWREKYCPAHDSDGTPKCCSCERLEPRGTGFVMLDDGRWLCLECMESAVIMDTYEAHNLHLEIREFFHGLNMEIEKEFPLLLVEKQALYKAEEEEKIEDQHGVVTRGICLSEVQTVTSVSKGPKRGGLNNKQLEGKVTESQQVDSGCPVTAILILYGLPRLLTGSLMAHEMMHAYLRLNKYNNLNKVLEEGLCQVLGHMWLETQRYAPIDVSAASSSSSSNAAKKGEWSELEKKLVDFYKNEIETAESEVYGVGFRKVNNMVTNSSLHETLKEIILRGRG